MLLWCESGFQKASANSVQQSQYVFSSIHFRLSGWDNILWRRQLKKETNDRRTNELERQRNFDSCNFWRSTVNPK
jgi:hypothetical protein